MGQFPFLQLCQVWALPALLWAPHGLRWGGVLHQTPQPTSVGASCGTLLSLGCARWDWQMAQWQDPCSGDLDGSCVALVLCEQSCS